MPASTTPSAPPFTHEETHGPTGDLGTGGRPPITPRRTGGGGEGDGEGWQHQPAGKRGPRERLETCRKGLFFAIAGDGLFFLVLATAWLTEKSSRHVDVYNHYVSSWHALQLPRILWFTTGIILLSSVTAELARRQMFHETDVMEEWLGLGRPAVRRTLPWLVITTLLGTAFLTGQWLAWMQITHARSFHDSGQSHQLFGVIAMLHAMHVLIGLAALLVASVGIFRLARIESRQILVDCTAWYWHAMGFFWVCLFAMLLLSN